MEVWLYAGFLSLGVLFFFCKDIILEHKGTIEYTGKEDSGAEFTITLPVQEI